MRMFRGNLSWGTLQMSIRAILLAAVVAAPLAACATDGYGYYPMPQPIPGGGYGGGGYGTPNYGLQPSYGTLNLNAGFQPDPRVVNLQSGGNIEASSFNSNCRGFIASAPDVRVNYNAGGYPLIISVASNTDTTLVINGPNGQWYCDDDSGNGTNPSIRFNGPQSGQYDIWVGTYGSASTAPASLYVSEVSSQ